MAACAGTDPDVAVTVTVYVPAGVPPVGVPPLFEDEPLLPPQAVSNNRPITIRNMSSKLIFFRRDPLLAPSNMIPPKGSNIA